MKCLALIISLVLFFIPIKSSPHTSKVFILVYHTFLNIESLSMDVSLEKLKFQITQCLDNGYQFVTFDDLLNGEVYGVKNILVTVDDGNISAYRAYKEVFKPLDIKPVFAIYPCVIGKQRSVMNWDIVNYLIDEGCTVASHGYYHLYIDDKLFEKDSRSYYKEIFDSKKEIEEHTGKKVSIFVYPFGAWSQKLIEDLKLAGYLYGMILSWEPVVLPFESDYEKFTIPRYMIINNWHTIFKHITMN